MTTNSSYLLTSISGTPIYWLCEQDVRDDLSLLAPAEARIYAALRTPKRRHDWLLGRGVAKRLIHAALAAELGSAPPFNEIVVLAHADGWPQVSLPTLGPGAPPLTLSISHSRDRAFCALTFGDDRPLGCDLEAIEPRSPGFVADYFTTAERDFMAAAPADQHPTLANAIWSGKEAALKAIRRGLAEDTRLVTCLPALDETSDGWRSLYFRWEVTDRDLPALAGRWCEAGEYVMTLAASGSQTNFNTGRGAPV